jgi:hypothetical protein
MVAVFSNIVVTAMSVTFFLLATQAEPVTATLGYVFGAILAMALIRQVLIQAKIGD